MRTLALLALAAFTSGVAAAQPTAADSALVDRLATALGFAPADRTDAGTAQGPTDISVAVRAEFLSDLDRDLVTEALGVLEGDAYARIGEQYRSWGEEHWGGSTEDALSGPRADSALAARYIGAFLDASQPAAVLLEVVEEARRSLPDSTVRLLDESGIFDEVAGTSEGAAEQTQRQREQAIEVARLALADACADDLEALAAYYRSPAGLYVGRKAALASNRAILLPMLEMMARMAAVVPDE